MPLLADPLSTFLRGANAEDSIISIPNQHPFEYYHRRLLPELPNALASGSPNVRLNIFLVEQL